MKKLLFIVFCSITATLSAQSNPEVYLMGVKKVGDSLFFENPLNISNNEGYDNQPSFYDNDQILFSSNRGGQTDIKRYVIKTGTSTWLSATPNGSEYSPLKIKGSNAISAIRLDEDGTQLLYRYSYPEGNPEILLNDLKVGYHLWFNTDILVTTVLTEQGMDLVVNNFKDNSSYTVQKNVGRSLHKIPNSDLISYINKEDTLWTIKSLNPISGATAEIIRTYLLKEDICWLDNETLLTGYGNRLYRYNPKKDKDWKLAHIFKGEDIHMISRMAINPEVTKFALVADLSPELIVQKHIEAFNNKDIEALLNTFSDNAKIYGYGHLLLYEGKDMIKREYAGYFRGKTDLNYSIKDKTVMDNDVHHAALITADNQTKETTYLYTVVNGKIVSLTYYVEP